MLFAGEALAVPFTSSSFPAEHSIGCAAGFMNVPRIKGSRDPDILSGVLAAEHVVDAIKAGRANDELSAYEAGMALLIDRPRLMEGCAMQSPCGRRLRHACRHCARRLRHVDPEQLGVFLRLARSVTASRTLQRSSRAAECPPIAYPKADGKLTFDRLSSVFLSNTNHEEDQPVHLKVADLALQKSSNMTAMAAPRRAIARPAFISGSRRVVVSQIVINAQNCVRCKTCDIKEPNQNITWVPPGGRRRAQLPEYVS